MPDNTFETDILVYVLDRLEKQERLDPGLLNQRFPGREKECETVLRALSSYDRRLRGARSSSTAERSSFPRSTQSPPDLDPGTLLGGYRTTDILGRGAMGTVYRARQEELGEREVALKVLHPSLVASDARFGVRFKREAALAAGIHHPNLAEVYGGGEEKGFLFFAMRLVEGRTLATRLEELGREQRRGETGHCRSAYIRKVVRLVVQVARAGALIHARGMVHRDIKPANIILEPTADTSGRDERLAGRPVLIDFGLLRPMGPTDLTGTRTVLHTPDYASPESKLGRGATPQADVFSLGVVFHDLLTLRSPARRGPASAGMEDVRVYNPAVDGRLAAILEMALQERPHLRYADCGCLTEDLERYLEHRPLRARPSTPVGRALLWARRRPLQAVRNGAIVLALLVLAALATWLGTNWLELRGQGRALDRFAREGRLLDAAGKAGAIMEKRDLATFLPGLGDIARQAALYTEDQEIQLLCNRLRTATPEQTGIAFRQINHLLLGGDEPHPLREVLVRFLLSKLRGGGKEQDEETALAAIRSLAQYLLIRPLPWPGDEDFHGLAGEIAEALWREVENPRPDRDPEYCRNLASCLSGIHHPRTLRGYTSLLAKEDDPHIGRLVMTGAQRIADYQIDQDRWPAAMATAHTRFINQAWAYLARQGLMERNAGGPIRKKFKATFCEYLINLAGLQELGPQTSPVLAGRIAEGPASYLAITRSLFKLPSSPNRDPQIPPGPFSGYGPKNLAKRVRSGIERIERKGPPFLSYKNIWHLRESGKGEKKRIVNDAPDINSPTARVDFREAEPLLEGAVLSVAWTGGRLTSSVEEDQSDHAQRKYFLKLDRPGTSLLRVSVAVPRAPAGEGGSDWKWLRVRAEMNISARWPLPLAGWSKLRFSVNEEDNAYEFRESYLGARTFWKIIDFPFHTPSRKREMELLIRLIEGVTLYRVKRIEIRFHATPREETEAPR